MASNRRTFVMQMMAGAAAIIAERRLPARAEKIRQQRQPDRAPAPRSEQAEIWLVDPNGKRLAKLSADKPATNGMITLTGVAEQAGELHGVAAKNGDLLMLFTGRGGMVEKGMEVSATASLS